MTRLGWSARAPWARVAHRLLIGVAGPAGVLALLGRPASVLADAVGTGDPTPPGGPNGLGAVLGPVAAIAGLVLVVVVLIGIGSLVARIGGQPAGPDHTRRQEPPAHGRLRELAAGTFLGAMALGALLAGRWAAGQASLGGLSGIFATVELVFVGGAIVAGLVIVGLAAAGFRHGHLSPAIATVFLAAALAVGGAIVGAVTARATAGVPRAPVILRADARLHLELAVPSLPFTSRDDGEAECRSGGDSTSVNELSGLDLGELGSGTLRVGLALGSDVGLASGEFFIDGGDLPEGSPMVVWTGAVVATPTRSDRSAGRLTFTSLPLSRGDGKPAADSAPPMPGAPWPSTLSGTLTWTCGPWSAPASDGIPPAPSTAPVSG